MDQLVNRNVLGVRVGPQDQPLKNEWEEEDGRGIELGVGLLESTSGLAVGGNEAKENVEEGSQDVQFQTEENLGDESLAEGGGGELVVAEELETLGPVVSLHTRDFVIEMLGNDVKISSGSCASVGGKMGLECLVRSGDVVGTFPTQKDS